MHIRSATTLYFIRHGQTPSNAAGIKQGIHIDDYLNTRGVLQVERAAELIKLLELDILLTSYLHRAEETTMLIYKHLQEPIPIVHDYRLRERDFGTLTGKTELEWKKLLPDFQQKEDVQMYDYRPFGGESVDEVRQRVLGAILDVTQNYNHKNVGLVTHDGIIRLLLFHFPLITRIYRNQDGSSQDIANTDIYEWEITESLISNIKSLLTQTPQT